MRWETAIRMRAVLIAAVGFCLVASLHGVAQTQALESPQAAIVRGQAFNGSWVINESLSDNTDDAVEAAIKKAGGKVKRRFLRKRPEDFYRGGPAEQELYDRISYDDVLSIAIDEPELRFEYADNFVRLFHSDGRRRRTTANSFYEEGAEDFSFANWNGDTLIVESRPRDGGFTLETYTLIENGARLRIEMQIEPDAFGAAVELVRVFDRVPAR
jgi:hypothetical protein